VGRVASCPAGSACSAAGIPCRRRPTVSPPSCWLLTRLSSNTGSRWPSFVTVSNLPHRPSLAVPPRVAKVALSPIGAHHYRVGELLHYLRELFSRDPVVTDVWVSGEIVDLTRSAAGHCYFTLRDADARIGVLIFRSSARRHSVPV